MGLKNTYQARKRFTKVPVSKTGMWYQDRDVVVPSNQITMKGPNGESDYFNSPIMGTGMQSGQTQVMYPGREYSFPNDNSVYETKMQSGGLFPVGPYDEMMAPKQGNYLLPDINRPYYIDDFGGMRSEYKMGFNDNGKETLIPTVVNGRQLTEDQAINNYFKTGLNMGKYNSVDDAEYASKMRTAKYNMFQDPVRFQMQIGGETSTEQNPVRMNYVDVFTKRNKPESSDWFTKAIRALIPLPANASQLIASSITGDDKYGWDDMNESSRYELMRSIENARKRTGKNKGGTEYIDYGKNIQQDINNLGVNGFDMVLGSLLSPEFKTATTLGRVSYEYDPNTKTYSVYDSYDFNSTNVDKGIYSKIRNTAGKIAPNKGKTHLIARYTEDDYNTYKNDFSKNRISYDDVSNFTNNAADKINNFPKNVANSVNEYVDPLIKSFKSNLPKMEDGAEKLTEDNPELIGQVHVRAKDKGWFDKYIERPLRKWGRSYAKRISDATGGSEWYKQPNSVASAFFSTGPGFALEAPQLSATYAATGKVQTPSEAMNIQNPYGAFAVDALLDPSSALTLGSRTVNRAGRFLLDGLDNQVSRQINKNPKLALSLQNRRPIQSIDNVTISPGLRPGDVRSFGDYITTSTIKSKGDISELGFFEGLNKGTQSLDNSLRRRIEDLSSTEGFNRLVNQEKEYLINSGTDASVAERVAKLNAKARIDELKNTTNINNDAFNYSRENFLGGVDNKFVKNKKLYSNAYFDKNYNNNIEDKIKNITGKFNLQKPVENYSKSKPGGIGIGYNFVNNKPIEMHEIAHALQRGRKLPIDNQLRQLTPKNKLELRDQKAYDYFNQGSKGKEASAFANELRESMFQKGFIPDYYSPINEQQIQDAYKYFKKNPIGVYDPKDGDFLSNTRIFDFMQPNKANSKILTDVLNKLPAAAPIVGGVGIGASQLQKKKYGGLQMSYLKTKRFK